VKRIAIALSLTATVSVGMISSAAPDRAGWPKELSFGIIPAENSNEMGQRFKPLIAHIEKRLGLPVKAYFGPDQAAVVVGMQGQKIDLAYLEPLSYVQAARMGGAEAFAKENTIKTGLGFSSLIVSRADSKIKTLADAKGKSFAFVDPASVSGYLLPMMHFEQVLNIKPTAYFKAVRFGGSHEANIEAVIEGEVQVAATSDGEIKSERDLNVLWKSDPIPTSPIAYRKALPESLKAAIREAVLGFNDAKSLARVGLKGFAPAKDTDYDVIRKLEEFRKSLK
jgi:phosphonate transport system substrate-binding protein